MGNERTFVGLDVHARSVTGHALDWGIAQGKTAYAIARDLNKDAVPTAPGARAWSQTTVRALLMRESVH